VQDTAEAVRTLTLLADLGLTADLDADSDFAALRAVPAVQAVASRLAANAQPLIRSRVAATLPEPDFFAEGISHDPRRGVWYVASIRHRKVSRIDSAGVAVDVISRASTISGGARRPRRPENVLATMPHSAMVLAYADSGAQGSWRSTGERSGPAASISASPAASVAIGRRRTAMSHATDSRDPATGEFRRASRRKSFSAIRLSLLGSMGSRRRPGRGLFARRPAVDAVAYGAFASGPPHHDLGIDGLPTQGR
jgi:hypothetical protein